MNYSQWELKLFQSPFRAQPRSWALFASSHRGKSWERGCLESTSASNHALINQSCKTYSIKQQTWTRAAFAAFWTSILFWSLFQAIP